MTKHSHYHKDVSRLTSIDVYRVLDLFAVTDPCIQHAVKKLLCAGVRGSKPMATDIQEAIDTLERWKSMRAEDQVMPAEFGQQHTFEPASAMQDDSERMLAIGQNGNDGLGSGWIKTDGVRSPFESNSLACAVELMHRSGLQVTVDKWIVCASDEKQGYWLHTGSPLDIIGYRKL